MAKFELRPPPGFRATNFWHLIATGLGSGLSPVAPGTVGTIAGAAFYLLCMAPLSDEARLIATGVGFALGTVAAARASTDFGAHDHGAIVIDEIVAIWLCLLWVPQDPFSLALVIIAFRGFDIAKPWPISWLDRKVHGGIGVMLDDILAAICAVGVVWLVAVARTACTNRLVLVQNQLHS